MHGAAEVEAVVCRRIGAMGQASGETDRRSESCLCDRVAQERERVSRQNPCDRVRKRTPQRAVERECHAVLEEAHHAEMEAPESSARIEQPARATQPEVL